MLTSVVQGCGCWQTNMAASCQLPHLLLHAFMLPAAAVQNVCIKANELDLAQDVYKQMLAEGCAPNLVTYNILIDVYVKKGQWEEAVKILDTLEQQVMHAARAGCCLWAGKRCHKHGWVCRVQLEGVQQKQGLGDNRSSDDRGKSNGTAQLLPPAALLKYGEKQQRWWQAAQGCLDHARDWQ
jgi:pentatricopeptide repeat protein